MRIKNQEIIILLALCLLKGMWTCLKSNRRIMDSNLRPQFKRSKSNTKVKLNNKLFAKSSGNAPISRNV